MPCSHNENDSIALERNHIKQHHAGVVKRLAGNVVVVFVDVDEKHADIKLQALESALGKIDLKTRRRLDGLNVYLSPAPPVRCIAFFGTMDGRRTYTIFLGDKMLMKTPVLATEASSNIKGGLGQGRGVADQQYDAKRKGLLNPSRLAMGRDAYKATKIAAKATAVIVHEFGHVLHETNAPEKYWREKKKQINAELVGAELIIASKVSQYAAGNRLEFVAEVFTGLIFGVVYPADVLSLYKRAGGIEVL